MKELVFMRERPLGPLMVAVNKLCVIGQAFIVTDVLVQGVSIVSCVERTTSFYQQEQGKYKLYEM